MKYHARKGPSMVKAVIYCLFLLGLALPGMFSLQQVHADGGAPNLAYVAGASQGVGLIDVAQRRVTGRLAVAGDPYIILLSPDGRLLYVTQPTRGQVTALATKTGQAICNATFPGHPSLLALSVDGTVLYVAGMNERTIIALDSHTCVLRNSFQATEPISWLAVAGVSTSNAPQTQLWVAGMTAVGILDEQGHVLDSIPIEGGPRFLCLPGALTAYVTTGQGSVVAVDMLTHQVFASLLKGGVFGPMDYDAVTGDIYVPDQVHNRVDVLSPVLDGSALVPQEPERIIRLSGSPQSIAITSDGQLGFVALSGGNVDMLDIPGRSTVSTIFVGGRPHFIITGPYPPPGVPTQELADTSRPSITLWVLIAALIIGVLLGTSWFTWRYRKGSAPKI